MNILFVGNSYTVFDNRASVPDLLERLCKENGKDVRIFSVTKGGRKLISFIEKDDIYTQSLAELASVEKFDICFLQECSFYPVTDFDIFELAVKELVTKFSFSVNEFILYETWGRREGNLFLKEHDLDNKAMTKILVENYGKVAKELGLRVSHVGTYFYDIYTTHNEIELYLPDNSSHATYAGYCLSALTHYKTVFGELPKKSDSLGLPCGIIEAFLKSLAQEDHEIGKRFL